MDFFPDVVNSDLNFYLPKQAYLERHCKPLPLLCLWSELPNDEMEIVCCESFTNTLKLHLGVRQLSALNFSFYTTRQPYYVPIFERGGGGQLVMCWLCFVDSREVYACICNGYFTDGHS